MDADRCCCDAYETSGGWTESGITWNNRPSVIGGAVADIGNTPRDTWVEYDLTGHVTGDGVYDFGLLPDSTNGVRFDSREASSPPELMLVIAGSGTNIAPVADDDVATTVEGVAITIDVAANDDDTDGELDLASVTTGCATCVAPAHGSLVNNGNGTFAYTPAENFFGTDSFVYEICDTLSSGLTESIRTALLAPRSTTPCRTCAPVSLPGWLVIRAGEYSCIPSDSFS